MSGILFLKTKDLGSVRKFYEDALGCDLWLDQKDCVILRHGNFLFGFCDRDEVHNQAMLTFFYESREEVDRMYYQLKDAAVTAPAVNEKYNIYQFFAHDPEGRVVEIQYFNRPVAEYRSGDDLLLTRRSVRKFLPDEITPELVRRVVDLSRYAPTARNTESYYFKFVRDRETIEWLAGVRDKNSRPIANAPIAVAICADPALSKRHIQDGCIGAYHFILAAWFYGLGTCWMAGLDRDDVKARLGIPLDHYVVTVTPLGFPEGSPEAAPTRKAAEDYVKGDW
jgi:nitroreductase/predicted lactoylglutathione lyase